jgi:hypothetical protein
LAVALLGLVADIPLITMVALAKSPFMLFKGWGRLLHDLVGRHGACLEAACVPFAGLALVLWPVVVVVSVLFAIVSSPILGLFGAVIVYQVSCYTTYVILTMQSSDYGFLNLPKLYVNSYLCSEILGVSTTYLLNHFAHEFG